MACWLKVASRIRSSLLGSMHKTGQRYGPPTALWCDSSSHSSLAAFDLKNLLNNSHLSGGFVDDDDSSLGAQHALLNTF